MPINPHQLVERRVRRVRRRLLLQKILECLVGFWAAGLLLCAAWFLARPFVISTNADWARWAIPAGILVAATLAAFAWAILHRPPFVTASLALDEQFELKERVTTFTLLSAEDADSPAGQALLADVQDKVASLDVPRRFPIKLRWSASLMPLGAGLLAVAASFFDPSFLAGNNNPKIKPNVTVNAKEIQQQLDNLRKVAKKDEDKDALKTEKLKDLEAEWEKLTNKALDPNNKEQVRERTNELAKLEEKMQKRIQDLKDTKAAKEDLKKALEKLALDKLGKKLQDGPAKDLEDALSKGKFDKAREVLEKLQKDLQDGKLNKEDLRKLAEQMKDLQDKLKRLTDKKQREDELRKEFKDDPARLQQELDKLDREMDDLKDLQDLEDLIGDLKDCLQGGNGLKAGQIIKAALEKVKEIELSDQELKKLMEEQKLLAEAQAAMLRACNGDCDANGKFNGMGKGKRPGGKRPVGEEPDSKNVDTRQKAEVDPLGQQKVTGFSTGGNFKKIPAKEVGGAFQRVAQEAQEAIDRQRIPSEAQDQVKGYFQKLGGQK